MQNYSSMIVTPEEGQPIKLDELAYVSIDEGDGPIPKLTLEIESVPVAITPESTRVEGVEGYPFRLADGRIWHLARPSLRIRPMFLQGKVTVENRWDYPPTERAIVQQFVDAVETTGATVSNELIVNVAFALVRRCHDIDAEFAASLFELSMDEVEDLAVGMLRMFRGFSPVLETITPEEPEASEKAE